jgi:peroxiredoxin
VLAVCEVIYLVHVNRALAADYTLIRAIRSDDLTLTIGQTIEWVVGFDTDGRRALVSFRGSSKSLVFGISSGCPACRASLPAFRRLGALAIAAGCKVVFVSKDYLPDMIHSPMASQLPGTLISEPTYRTYRTLKLNVVPTTMLLSQHGLVEKVVVGQLDESKERQIASDLSR